MAINIALPTRPPVAYPETPPEEYLPPPPFSAFLPSVGKDGRTAGTLVHRTLMKQKFRLTQPVIEYMSRQDLALAYELCSTLRLLEDGRPGRARR
jgi:hypothetical protein